MTSWLTGCILSMMWHVSTLWQTLCVELCIATVVSWLQCYVFLDSSISQCSILRFLCLPTLPSVIFSGPWRECFRCPFCVWVLNKSLCVNHCPLERRVCLLNVLSNTRIWIWTSSFRRKFGSMSIYLKNCSRFAARGYDLCSYRVFDLVSQACIL